MGKTKKTLEEMDVMDDFLVNAAALDQELGEEFCRLILETLLQGRSERSISQHRRHCRESFPRNGGSGWMWRFWKGKIRNQA